MRDLHEVIHLHERQTQIDIIDLLFVAFVAAIGVTVVPAH
jgi:hypothetical protein